MKNATTTKKEYEYYRLAKEAIDRGEAENALFNIRKALERVVKVLCGQCNIDTYKVDLCDLIQKRKRLLMMRKSVCIFLTKCLKLLKEN